MNRALLFAVNTALLSTIHQADAGPAGYQCVVVQELHLARNGTLKAFPRPLEVGKRFAINRTTGALAETTASFWSPSDAITTVLATGNNKNSFVVSYVAPSDGGGVHATHVSIDEFSEGSKKPFIVTSSSGIYSGTCE